MTYSGSYDCMYVEFGQLVNLVSVSLITFAEQMLVEVGSDTSGLGMTKAPNDRNKLNETPHINPMRVPLKYKQQCEQGANQKIVTGAVA